MNRAPGAVIAIRPATTADAAWIAAVMEEDWGGPTVWTDGRLHDALSLPALIAGDRRGLAIYDVACRRAALVLLHALGPHCGIGTALVDALVGRLLPLDARELWLTTTNDNLDARFASTSAADSAWSRCGPVRWRRDAATSPPSRRSATTASRCATSCGWSARFTRGSTRVAFAGRPTLVGPAPDRAAKVTFA